MVRFTLSRPFTYVSSASPLLFAQTPSVANSRLAVRVALLTRCRNDIVSPLTSRAVDALGGAARQRFDLGYRLHRHVGNIGGVRNGPPIHQDRRIGISVLVANCVKQFPRRAGIVGHDTVFVISLLDWHILKSGDDRPLASDDDERLIGDICCAPLRRRQPAAISMSLQFESRPRGLVRWRRFT